MKKTFTSFFHRLPKWFEIEEARFQIFQSSLKIQPAKIPGNCRRYPFHYEIFYIEQSMEAYIKTAHFKHGKLPDSCGRFVSKMSGATDEDNSNIEHIHQIRKFSNNMTSLTATYLAAISHKLIFISFYKIYRVIAGVTETGCWPSFY